MKNVSAVFETRFEAERAVSQLMSEGFSNNDISLIMSDSARNAFAKEDEEIDRVAKGGAAGAAIGSTLGALLAGLTAVGSIVVSGGGLLVAGPIVAILSGAGAGGIIGGLSGALIKAGYESDDAERFAKDIEAGKAIVVVHCRDDIKEGKARAALSMAGANPKAA